MAWNVPKNGTENIVYSRNHFPLKEFFEKTKKKLKKPKKWKIEKIQFIHGFILHYRNIFLRKPKKMKDGKNLI